jgi:hypothetical protein
MLNGTFILLRVTLYQTNPIEITKGISVLRCGVWEHSVRVVIYSTALFIRVCCTPLNTEVFRALGIAVGFQHDQLLNCHREVSTNHTTSLYINPSFHIQLKV